jgi:cytochrome P450
MNLSASLTRTSSLVSDHIVCPTWQIREPCLIRTVTEIPTFLSAGHDTTSNALAWIIFEISQRPNLQLQLRQELSAIGLSSSLQDNEPLTADELSALEKLPLLDAVVRESLRLHAPVPATIRIAERDDVIPVAGPYMDKHGAMHESIEVRKGDIVPVHLMVVNRSKDLWGNDAEEWK